MGRRGHADPSSWAGRLIHTAAGSEAAGEPTDEALGLAKVCIGEHLSASGAHRCRPLVMDIGRIADTGMAVPAVVPAEAAAGEGAGVLQ